MSMTCELKSANCQGMPTSPVLITEVHMTAVRYFCDVCANIVLVEQTKPMGEFIMEARKELC